MARKEETKRDSRGSVATQQIAWKQEKGTWAYGTMVGRHHVRLWSSGKIIRRPRKYHVLRSPIHCMQNSVFGTSELRSVVSAQPALRADQAVVLADRRTKTWRFGRMQPYTKTGGDSTLAFSAANDPVMQVVSPTVDVMVQTTDVSELVPGTHIGILVERKSGSWPASSESSTVEWRKCTVTDVVVMQTDGNLRVHACLWHSSARNPRCFVISPQDAFFIFAHDVPAITLGRHPVLSVSKHN